MPAAEYDQALFAAERAALQAICQGAGGTQLWDQGIRLLASYRFRNATHQLVFEAMQQVRYSGPAQARRDLQRRLVLSGFPGLDAGDFFQPHGLTIEEARELIRRLAEGER